MTTATVIEGCANVYLPSSVFYNPVQEFNRDLTIAVISEYFSAEDTKTSCCADTNLDESSSIKTDGACDVLHDHTSGDCGTGSGIRILEALAASGLRSVRFALEIPNVKEVVANDYDENAVQFIRRNADSNNVAHLITASCNDAAMLMYASRSHSCRFDVVDLDPYGSPAPFLDAAVQCIADGGLLCVTCTDMAVLCGNAAETCQAKYGAVSLRTPFCHEMALRIILQNIGSHAARYQRYIEPLLSVSVDFYIRVFVRLQTGQSRVKDLGTQLSTVFHCRSCGVFTLQPLMTKSKNRYVASSGPVVDHACQHCSGRHCVAGPIWSSPIHDVGFVRRVRDSVASKTEKFPNTRQRIDGMLSVVCEELVDVPLYYIGDSLCSVLHCTSPGFIPLRSALLHAGYKVSLSHAQKSSIKTNAPASAIWDIMRCWVRSHPVNENRLQEGSIARSILAKEPQLEACFDPHPSANPPSRANGLVRWQMNPSRNWGPKARATRSCKHETVEERRLHGSKKADQSRAKRKADRNLKQFACKRYREGACSHGDNCQYSHDDDAPLENSLDT